MTKGNGVDVFEVRLAEKIYFYEYIQNNRKIHTLISIKGEHIWLQKQYFRVR
jgi:hypothetical protein